MTVIKTISILGCGWLGLPLAEACSKAGFNVKGSTTRQERMPEIAATGAVPYVLKAENGGWIGEQMDNFLQCDMLVIAIPPGTKRNANSTHAIEIGQLTDYIQKHSINIEKIIYISSTSVYKNTNSIVVETDTEQQENIENRILFQAETYIQQCTVADFLILRLGGLTGYDRMLGRFFAGKQELAGGNEPVNLVHRDDVLSAILYLIKAGIEREVINICSPQHPSRKEFYTHLCNRFNMQPPHFSNALVTDWKAVSSEKLNHLGYRWLFPNPLDYTYTY